MAAIAHYLLQGTAEKGEGRSNVDVIRVNGANDRFDAIGAALSIAPPTVDVYIRLGARATDIGKPGSYNVDVVYGPLDGETPSNGGDIDSGVSEYSLDLSSTLENERIYKSIQTVSSYASGGADPLDMEGALNVQWENGRNVTEGTDILVGTHSLAVTFSAGVDALDGGYSDLIESLAGHVNDDTIEFEVKGQGKSYALRELRFDGGGMQWLPDKGYWRVSLNFSVKRSREVDGGDMGTITVNGWDHLHWRTTVITSSNGRLTLKFSEAWVDQVYPEADLSALFPAPTDPSGP